MSDIDKKICRLILIGAGLGTGRYLTLEAIKAMKESDVIYAEEYTASLHPNTIKQIERQVGRKPQFLSRHSVEDVELPLKVLDEAAEAQMGATVAFLTSGDALSATTHIHLLVAAKEKGYQTKMVFGVSILSAAVSASGLSHYKFGRTVTIPFPEPNFEPTSPIEGLIKNKDADLHTLVLLDIKAEQHRFMTVNQGLEQMLAMADKIGTDAFSTDTFAIGLARIGDDGQTVVTGTVGELLSYDFGAPMHCIIVPASMSVVEEESVELLTKRANK